MEEYGIKLLRFWNTDVNDRMEGVLDKIKEDIDLRPAKGEVATGRRG